jgi:nitrate reductase gamma subunit
MYALARGPLALAAVLILFLGLAYQTVRFVALTRQVSRSRAPWRQQPGATGVRAGLRGAERKAWVARSVLGMEPSMTVVTTGFHVALILTPLTVLAHALLFEQSWGSRPPSTPEALTDILTLVVLGLGFFLLYRRIRVPRVRSITTPMDIVLLAVVLAPFLTGFLAYHQWMPYRPMVVAHMLSGELMLVCIPFTRLSHALFFFLVRICLGSEYSFTRGSRDWR